MEIVLEWGPVFLVEGEGTLALVVAVVGTLHVRVPQRGVPGLVHARQGHAIGGHVAWGTGKYQY